MRVLQDSPQKRALAAWADDLSCAIFGLSNSVTLMYYIIDNASNKAAFVEGGVAGRPPWLGFAVHIFNSLVAWGDLLLAHPRSFSRRSSRLSTGVVVTYLAWILLCSHVSGEFPYPFLNKLPYPQVRPPTGACTSSALVRRKNCSFPSPRRLVL